MMDLLFNKILLPIWGWGGGRRWGVVKANGSWSQVTFKILFDFNNCSPSKELKGHCRFLMISTDAVLLLGFWFNIKRYFFVSEWITVLWIIYF